MRAHLALIRIDLKLALRNRSVLFFNYLFPLLFFVIVAQIMGEALGGGVPYIVSMVLIFGILGNGLFGAGVRATQEREANILRRYKVTPISPIPLLIASMITGWVVFIPTILIALGLAHFLYGMPLPERWLSLFVLISVGVVAFRAIGLILASVANSMQESNILVQILYMPMLFLSGATFPVSSLPGWAQVTAQFLPASYLVTGFQGVFYRNESLLENIPSVLALVATIFLATFISAQLFRWEKEEKIRSSAKLWVLAVLFPFIILGCYQIWSREHMRKADLLWRDLRRREVVLIRNARIFVGDGRVLESSAVLVKDGKIDEVFVSESPDPQPWKAEVVDAAGKSLLPGLIDVRVHLSAPGGILESVRGYDLRHGMSRALTAYLYSGITAVRSVGDRLETSLELRRHLDSGELPGSELFLCGPLFTSEEGPVGGYLTEFPDPVRRAAEQQLLRTPESTDEARRQVRELAAKGVDGIQAALESGGPGRFPDRMQVAVLKAIGDEAARLQLPLVVHTRTSQDVSDALAAGAAGIAHRSPRDLIPDELLDRMAERITTYQPTLSPLEARTHLLAADEELLDRSLVQQVGPRDLIEQTRKQLRARRSGSGGRRGQPHRRELEIAQENLRRAYRAGVALVAGSGAGNPLVFHGPTIHHELELWVAAGIPPGEALRAATGNAARHLGADDRIGFIKKGFEANLLLVDGNPLEDIAATERISLVIFKGERIRRSRLFADD